MFDISVIIPIFNTEEYLTDCLESVSIAIEKINAEVILVDDGSTDNSGKIAEDFAMNHGEFKYYKKENGGPGSARNYGVKRATGKYLSFVDSDDKIKPDMYTCMLSVAEYDGTDMVVCDVARLNGSKLTHSGHRRAFHSIVNRKTNIFESPSLLYDSTTWNKLIKKSLYDKIGFVQPENVVYEDTGSILKLYYYAGDVSIVRDWLYLWRVRTGSNKSTTQKHGEDKNLADKILMLGSILKFAKDEIKDQNIIDTLMFKILNTEFDLTLEAMRDMEPSKAERFLTIIANFIDQNIDLDVARDLPVIDQQKIRYILERDLDSIFILLNYKKLNYSNAPVLKEGMNYNFVLPSDIFTISNRNIKNEFKLSPYWNCLDSASEEDELVKIHGHLYIRRVDMPNLDFNKLKAFLVNDKTGARHQLFLTQEPCREITKLKGTIINADDYKPYHYNYDGSGYCIAFKLNDIPMTEEFMGKNYIMLESQNAIYNKTQLLRYVKPGTGGLFTKIQYCKNGVHLSVNLDELQYFYINLTTCRLDGCEKNEGRLEFVFHRPFDIEKPVFKSSDGSSLKLKFDKVEHLYYLDVNDLDVKTEMTYSLSGADSIDIKEELYDFDNYVIKTVIDEDDNLELIITPKKKGLFGRLRGEKHEY